MCRVGLSARQLQGHRCRSRHRRSNPTSSAASSPGPRSGEILPLTRLLCCVNGTSGDEEDALTRRMPGACAVWGARSAANGSQCRWAVAVFSRAVCSKLALSCQLRTSRLRLPATNSADTMCKLARTGWTSRSRRMVGAVLRYCLAIYLVLELIGTPLHLYLEPHSGLADTWSIRPCAEVPSVSGEGHHADSEHERHSAAQHDLKALRIQRIPVTEMATVAHAECLPTEKSRRHEQVLVFSGLSPPELPRPWQFVFRAALPVRAPSLAS